MTKKAEANSGVLVSGIFVEASHNRINIYGALVTLNQGSADPIQHQVGELGGCWACGQAKGGEVCAGGKVEVVGEFCTQSSERSKRESVWGYPTEPIAPDRLATGWDKNSLLALRLADLTVAYGNSKEVGGDIDVINLKKDGTMRWLARKKNCPDNQD